MDTFGRQLATTGSTPNPYRFGAAWGYITDPSGLLQLGARFYWPEVGRFVSRDPERDGTNWYAYTSNNPVVSVDANGRSMVGALCGAVRAVGRKVRDFGHAQYAGFERLLDQAESRFSGEQDSDKKAHCFVACMMTRTHPLGKWAGQATAYYAQRAWERFGAGIDSERDTAAADMGAFECGSDKKPGGCPKKRGQSAGSHCEDCCRGKVNAHAF
jgi:RHS repeat-associated protein